MIDQADAEVTAQAYGQVRVLTDQVGSSAHALDLARDTEAMEVKA